MVRVVTQTTGTFAHVSVGWTSEHIFVKLKPTGLIWFLWRDRHWESLHLDLFHAQGSYSMIQIHLLFFDRKGGLLSACMTAQRPCVLRVATHWSRRLSINLDWGIKSTLPNMERAMKGAWLGVMRQLTWIPFLGYGHTLCLQFSCCISDTRLAKMNPVFIIDKLLSLYTFSFCLCRVHYICLVHMCRG